ncbi:MAG: hypothetical protein QGG73_01680 [Candidatus Hydrogenedentes bacterium]|jgi:hypothetical protein|nr:hypothetical protein [Candidatus Hydrogenedentota bacterium]
MTLSRIFRCAAVVVSVGCRTPQATQGQPDVALGPVNVTGAFESAVKQFDSELKEIWPPEKLSVRYPG